MEIHLDGMRLVSTANSSEHWRKRHRRNKQQKRILRLFHGRQLGKVKLPCVITLIRVGPRALDGDNLAVSFKALRDEIATLILPEATQGNQHGRRGDDSDGRIQWRYDQQRGPYAVRIQIDEETK